MAYGFVAMYAFQRIFCAGVHVDGVYNIGMTIAACAFRDPAVQWRDLNRLMEPARSKGHGMVKAIPPYFLMLNI